MSIRQDPPRPLPPGERHFMDVVREIEAAGELSATGWHFGWEPSAEEIEYKRATFYDHDWDRVAPGDLVAVEIVTGSPQRSWTLFRRGADAGWPASSALGSEPR